MLTAGHSTSTSSRKDAKHMRKENLYMIPHYLMLEQKEKWKMRNRGLVEKWLLD
jgi:hypothetical protein